MAVHTVDPVVAGMGWQPCTRCLADIPRVISDIFDFTAEAAHFATLVRALCARPETSRRPGHTIGMVGKAQEVPGSARNGLVLRERRRKNHYTEFEFFRATRNVVHGLTYRAQKSICFAG